MKNASTRLKRKPHEPAWPVTRLYNLSETSFRAVFSKMFSRYASSPCSPPSRALCGSDGFPRSAPCRAGWRGGEAGNPARSDRFGHGTTGSVPLCGAVCEHAFIYRLLLPESFKGFHFLYFFFLKSSMERNCHSPASPLKRLCC